MDDVSTARSSKDDNNDVEDDISTVRSIESVKYSDVAFRRQRSVSFSADATIQEFSSSDPVHPGSDRSGTQSPVSAFLQHYREGKRFQ